MSPKIVLYNKLASVFLQNITTCRFVVESPLNPQEAVAFRSSASYSHRCSLVVHEVSFPGNTSNLQAPVRLCLEMLSPDRKQKQVHVFYYQPLMKTFWTTLYSILSVEMNGGQITESKC